MNEVPTIFILMNEDIAVCNSHVPYILILKHIIIFCHNNHISIFDADISFVGGQDSNLKLLYNMLHVYTKL